MKSNICEEDILFVYPDKNEIRAAQLACCGRCCTSCEAPAEYAWRKRSVDMSLLLEQAIENELSPIEKSAIKDRWLESLSVGEIALKRKISPAAVSATLKRAQEKLRRVLAYAVKYQNDTMSESVVPLVLGRAKAIAAARNYSGSSVAERLANLRRRENLSREAQSRATGIAASRLASIERGSAQPDLPELIALSGFFGVTTDYILKGENNDKQQITL